MEAQRSAAPGKTVKKKCPGFQKLAISPMMMNVMLTMISQSMTGLVFL
jgi:hypothetical protein